MILHESKYSKVHYNQDYGIISQFFFEETRSMTNDEFMHEMEMYMHCVLHKKVSFHYIDAKELRFELNLDIQKRLNETVFPALEGIISKVAFVLPNELITEMTLELTMSSVFGRLFDIHYFTNREQAMEWLLETLNSKKL